HLQPERDLSRHPLVQIVLVLQNTPKVQTGAVAAEIDTVSEDSITSKFDMVLSVTDSPIGLYGALEFAKDLFEPTTIQRFWGHFHQLLRGFVANTDCRLADLPLLTEIEHQTIVYDWNVTKPSALVQDIIPILFERQVTQTPDAIAIHFGNECLTYAELNERTNQLGHVLQDRGVGPETFVAVCLERSVDLIVSFLAVLKAGGAYLPLDPTYPAERLAFMMKDTQAPILLSQRALATQLPQFEGVSLLLDDNLEITNQPRTNVVSTTTPENVAYAIYTSGSTGQPKGVVVTHRSIVRLVQETNYISFASDDVVVQASNSAFDAVTFEIWGALLNGARLTLMSRDELVSPELFAEHIQRTQATTLFITTALFNTLSHAVPACFASMRQVLFGGEACDPGRIRDVLEGHSPERLLHVYGPTETTTYATWYPITSVPENALTVPIGSPLAHEQIYVLDQTMKPVPTGVAGELHIGGAGLARGYFQRPGLTAERFLPNPLDVYPGTRLYRTGDRTRWRPTGVVEYLDRLDQQVKLRGFRIELGEITAAIQRHPAISEAVVLVHDTSTGKQLAAYLVPANDISLPNESELRTFLRTSLPDYMIPAAFVPISAIPLTPNGKLDRAALPNPNLGVTSEKGYVAPLTPLENQIAAIWATVLEQERLGIHDDFFMVGGHSLLATQVISRLRATFQIDLPVRMLFDHPTIAELATVVAQTQQDANDPSSQVPLVPMPRTGPIPLSYAQQRLWFIEQLQPGTSAYHTFIGLQLQGRLRVAQLEASFQQLFDRHESLRTALVVQADEPQQVITEDVQATIPVVDLGGLPETQQLLVAQELGTMEMQRPFDLRQAPLLRTVLVRLQPEYHLLLLNQHHLITDNWSLGILVHELTAIYGSLVRGESVQLPLLPIQYADYAIWQRTWLQGNVLENQVDYWRTQLADLPTLELPLDFPRPAVHLHEGDETYFSIPTPLRDDLHAMGQQINATPFMVLLAGWQAVLARYSGQTDIVVGAPIANRTREELEGLLGFFVNTLVLRTDITAQPTGWEFLERVREVALGAYAHQDVPFEHLVAQIQPDRDVMRQPMFQVSIALQNAPMGTLDLPDVTVGYASMGAKTALLELVLQLYESPEGYVGRLEYAADLFEKATMERLVQHYERILNGLLTQPTASVLDLPLLTEAEQSQLLVDWQPVAPAMVPPTTIHEWFATQVAQRPDAVAVVFGGQSLSYQELDTRSNQLAHYLQTLDVGPDICVALWFDRSIEMITAILGVLKAGGAYLPMDRSHPMGRLALMIRDAKVPAVLTTEALRAQLPATDAQIVCLDTSATILQLQPTIPPSNGCTPDNLAYVIYTSGSTGTPKGVLIEHTQVSRLLAATDHWFHFTATDTWTMFHSYAFDFSVWEIWGALLYGGRLVIVPYEDSRDPTAFAQLVAQQQITILNQTPSAFREFMHATDAIPDQTLALRSIIFGGEALDPHNLQPWLNRYSDSMPQLINMYGITETTVHVTYRPITQADCTVAARSVIGTAIPDLQTYVLDELKNLMPVGIPGELYVGGAGLARGYLHRPSLTAERFVPDAFSKQAGTRLYRTGDSARYLASGELEYLGRVDQQVKVRGFRIELGEIEAALQDHEMVQTTVVLTREDIPGDKQLTAYIVPTSDTRTEAGTNGHQNTDHVAYWQTFYEETYHDVAPAASDDPTFNIIGWNSSYTNQPIPAEEMREWVNTTVARIQADNPQRILEIGCGTGLLLFRLAPHCQQYVGVDFSATALDYIRQHLDPNWSHVELHQNRADAVSSIIDGTFDMVIINSVIQYFPSVNYLIDVLAAAIPLVAPGGRVFLGDLRNLTLLESFAAAVQLAQAPAGLPRAQIRQRMQQQLALEEELVLDPNLFYQLPMQFPQISGVQVEIKRGWAHNELSQFRYDVTLWVDGAPAPELPIPLVDWQTDNWTLERVQRTLAQEQPIWLALRGVTSARLVEPTTAVRLLADPTGPATAAGVREVLGRTSGIEPETFWQLGEELGYQVLVSWDETNNDGTYTVLFGPTEQVPLPLLRTKIRLTARTDWSSYANHPAWEAAQIARLPHLRQYLSTRLPEYMVPSALIPLQRLPLTPNGKLDRQALPIPSGSLRGVHAPFVAPRTPTEDVVATIWARLLNQTQVGIHDDFFDLGGHSLLATRVIAQIRDVFGVELPVRALFETPILWEFAQQVVAAQRAHTTRVAPPLVAQPRTGADLPVSFAQQRLWFVQYLEPLSIAYHMPNILRLRGAINLGVLVASLRDVVARHESLRTAFPEVNGQPVQRITPPGPMPIPCIDLRMLTDEEREATARTQVQIFAEQPFDMAHGPLFRAALWQVSPDETVLVFILHHIIGDGWSQSILLSDLAAFYASHVQQTSPTLAPLPIQYADYAVWQRQWLSGPVLESQVAYWRRQLADLPTLQLPTDHPRPAIPSYRGADLRVLLDPDIANQVRGVAQQMNGTLFMVVLAAWQLLLARYSGQDDIVVGMGIAGRTHVETDALIGFFVNTLVLRTDVGSQPTGWTVLERVRTVTLNAYAHQDVPFEEVVAQVQPERDLSRQSLFQVLIVLQNTPRPTAEVSSVQILPMAIENQTAKFDLTLDLTETPLGLMGRLEYATDLYEAATIERLWEHYRTLLTGLVTQTNLPTTALPLISSMERQQLLVDWNRTSLTVAPAVGIHTLVWEQATRSPDRIALISGEAQLSYAMLMQQATYHAQQLYRLGVGNEVRVGLFMDRSIDMVVATLAVLMAGGVYVPLDPDYPVERLAFLVQDAQVAVVLTQEHLRKQLPETSCVVHCMASDREVAHDNSVQLPPLLSHDQLAYVMYTSGSTGTPKGVSVPHRAVTRLVFAPNYMTASSDDVFLQLAPTAFDAATLEIWAPLVRGARLVLAPSGQRSLIDIANLLVQHHVQVLWLTAGLFHLMVEQHVNELASVGQVLAGGDALSVPHVQQLHAVGGQVINGYGPTENTTFTCCYRVPGERVLEGSVPIGYPINQTQVYVVDRDIQPVPIGVPGELYTGGDGLARGYLDRPALTAERFLPNPFGTVVGTRMYRTGDRVRYLPDGAIEFLGRADHQIKLRGFRIELGEIEAVLQQHPLVQTGVVLLRGDSAGDKHLTAYVVPGVRNNNGTTYGDLVGDHIDQWQTLYEETYDEVAPVASDDPTFNIIGWNSSYTNGPIPAEEMATWVDTTVARIAAGKPQRILEIGCGTGLLLFRLAGQCAQYVGSDFSAAALDYVRQHLDPALEHVTLQQQRADDFTAFGDQQFDVIVLNSIVQYFPSADYLLRVLEGSLRLIAPGGRLFVGDVRNLALLDAFAAAIACYQAHPHTGRNQLWQQIQQLLTQERELLLDPLFFVALAKRFPQISNVEIDVKRGWAHNELSQFRYDVTLTVAGTPREPVPVEPQDWLAAGWTLDRVQEVITQEQPEWLYLTKVPNQRVQAAVQGVAQLADSAGPTTVEGLREVLSNVSGIEPETFWQLGEACGYGVSVSWSPDDIGCCDVLFHLSTTDAVVPSPQAGWTAKLSCEEYANQPIWDSTQRTLAPMLQEYVTTQLPEYMVPASVMVLARLPLTPNGKLDRAALPEPNQGMLRTGELVAPRTDVEKGLVTIWQSVLGIEQIGITDNFFELGGHSLLATQVISRIRTQYTIDLPVRTLFESPTIAQLAPVVTTAQRTTELVTLPSLQPMPRDQAIPLSFAQQRLWFIEQLHPGTGAYHVYAGLRLHGPLVVSALSDSLQTIVARHESLRTTFTVVDDQPMQIVHAHMVMQIPCIDLSAHAKDAQEAIVQELALRETYRPFDLVEGPLIRACLLRLHAREHVLLVNQHHIITDGWSLGVLVSELTSLYRHNVEGTARALSELPIQYPDYAIWQRTWLEGAVLAQQLDYWRSQLAQLTTLHLPTDYPRPPMPTYRGMNTFFIVDTTLLSQLQALSQQTGTTLFMTMLAGWQALLARYSGQDDIVVGSPIAGRTQTELESLIGFFVNTLVLRTNLAENPTIWETLARVQTVTLDAYAHQDVPFEYLVAELQPQRDLSRQPLFQVSFALQNMPQGTLQLSDLTIAMEPSHLQIAQFDMALHLQEATEGLFGRLEYAVDLFETATMERLLQHYQMLLRGFVDNPLRCLADVSLLTDAEQTQLTQWNETTQVYPQHTTLSNLLTAQAEHTPDRIALRSEDGVMSFGALHQRASCLAAYLQQHGVGPDVPVAVCVERSLDLLIGLVGVLYAGGTYIPLDPDYPADRLAFLLSDAEASLILTQAALQERIQIPSATNTHIIRLDTDWSSIQQASSHPTSTKLHPDHLAYIIYTSGSTGRPKGAMNTHQAIINRLLWMQDTYTLEAMDRVVQKTPYSFDVSVWELFWPLITGASLVVAAPGGHQDPIYLGDLIERECVTVLHFVPSMLQAFLENVNPGKLDTARDVVCSGEALPPSLQERFFAYTQTRLHNLYGPTEAAVDVTAWQCLPQSNRASVPIGYPIANTQMHILGLSGEQVPVGVPGELLIGGVQLARGYYHRPGLTAERFIPDSLSVEVGGRLYRTGDLARYRVDGAIEYMGRIDHQIKLRGFRIELGEIEAVLREHPDIQDAAVMVRHDRSDEPLLVGYVVPSADSTVDIGTLREYVQTQVPHYMVPGVLIPLERLPLTPNGKLDRAALPAPIVDRSRATAAYEAPRTTIEQQLAEIWQDVLGMEQVGVDDNFFELGGHSLLLTQVHRRIREQIAPELLLVDLFRYPTIAALATAITQAEDHQQSLEKSRARASIRAERTQQRRQQRQRNRTKD
ncbi:MAG: amino acid adenylation domain-containing protein, partial [Chloroflexota bacterium]